ncbi:unnamed protein product [Paramecium sonneborni]|uniref:Uncharacterized protein n=1 Tax=Paramecium sonneborni TaxID=65129 RepID=A0A8S1PGV2_9CILI|nr:unnamed protein product [Paramecium sonneborni]
MEDINYKIVLLGDAGVGKTYILNQYVRGQQPKNNLPTIGIEFATKTVTLQDGGKIQVSIWDTAGQERYRAITTNHFRGASGALLVYDITKEKTFENLTRWMEELKTAANKDVVMFLVGNKTDLVERQTNSRKVTKEEGQLFATKNQLFFEETSAYRGTNIASCFEKLIEEMYIRKNLLITQQQQSQSQSQNTQLKPIETPMCSKC